jgi:putative heme-binding domain-containing protein
LEALKSAPPEVHPSVLETISGRVDSSLAFMRTVASGQIPATMLNANQARRMLNMKHSELSELVQRHWGTVRSERDPSRAQLISQMRNTLRTATGDATSGQTIFRRVCGQCHKIYGQGAEVGPDITRNGRASFEQLLSNVFDPSLVIGAAYLAQTVITRDGRVLTGLLSEDSPQRVILKMPGDKQEVIAREEIEESVRSSLSLMPEGLEKQLQPQELADLFAFLILDRPPEDPLASYLPGAVLTAASAKDPKDFPALIEQLLPGFTTSQSGREGVALIPEYHGRPAVSTHPISRDLPCTLTASISIPKAENSKVVLRISAASADDGDWRLIVRINRRERLRTVIGRTPDKPIWQNIDVDVTDLAGQTATIELINAANNWSNEFAYWNAAELFISPEAAPATR